MDFTKNIMDLKDKIILVTGSSKGIGEATAYAFAKEKCILIVTYRSDREEAKKVAKKCEELGSPETFLILLDVRDNDSIKNSFTEVEKKFGHIDYLINNAGVIDWEKFENESFTDIENQLRTNLEGVIKMTSAYFPQIKEGIVNVASRAGHMAFIGRSVYVASKFGVIGFTKSISLEYPNLKIFSVSPGATATAMWNFKDGVDPSWVGENIVKAIKGKVKLVDSDLPLWKMANK